MRDDDLTATGAKLSLGGGGTLAANGNVTLEAAQATSSIDSNSSGSDSHGSYAESLHRSIDMLATTLEVGDSLTVASGDVNIGAATQTHVDKSREQQGRNSVASTTQVASSRDITRRFG